VRLARYVTSGEIGSSTVSGAVFGDQITLVQYSLCGTHLRPRDVLQVEFLWQTNARLDQYYKVFAQLLNANGGLVAQHDSEPQGGLMPTVVWRPGEVIIDRHGITLPDDLPPGDYTLIVGIYRRDEPNTRLLVGAGDFLELGVITVE
jgi:hypothetical protein